MTSVCQKIILLLIASLALSIGSITVAKEDSDSKVSNEDVKSQVLDWVDQYRKVQVLFHDDDIAKLRKELEDDSPEEAARWWNKTKEMRAALDSSEWAETREWFREFLRVQAIFSDKQIEELRTEVKTAAEEGKSREFTDILGQVEHYRSNLVKGAASDRAVREHQLKLIDAYRKEETSQRATAAKAAAFSTNTVQQAPNTPRPARYPTRPLIDSLDVARWSVLRGLWRY